MRWASSRRSVAALWALCRDAGEHVEHLRVDLARVGLAGDGVGWRRSPSSAATSCSSCRTLAWSPSNSSRKLACVPVVPLTPRALSCAEPVLDLRQVEHQVVGPQAGPLADGRRLGRLQVREAQARQVAVLVGERRPGASITAASRSRDQLQRLAHQDQVGVVGDVAARRAQVDDRPGRRGTGRRRRGRGPSRRAAASRSYSVGRVEVDVVDVRAAARRSAAGVIGSPSSASASASATHSRRQVLNFRCGPHSSAHLGEA